MTLNSRKRKDQRKTRHLNVLLNGVDVSKDCFYADGRRGVVRRFKRIDGKYVVVGNSLATEELRGHVRWVKLREV